jgi:hypothetical protein
MTFEGSVRIGIWMGDSFAEICADQGTSATLSESKSEAKSVTTGHTSRWFHPKKSLAEGLRDILKSINAAAIKAGEICIATSRAEMSVARRQGSEPVTLVTAGFETWARLGTPLIGSPSLRAQRSWFPTSSDKIFGIEERMGPDGSVVRALDLSELEFLVAKLELLKTKEIAIAFLHGHVFSAHEKAAAKFFRERGYNVTCSCDLLNVSSLSDVERVRRTAECAFAETVIQDDLAMVKAVLKEEGLEDNWKIQFWSSKGLTVETSAAAVRGGVEAALANAMPETAELSYFFGIEEFLGFTSHRRGAYLLPVQPTTQIGVSAWPFPSWTEVDRGYEPGPMLFGKSHQLTVLDILFVRDRLMGDIEGFSDRVQAKASVRILEALFTLGKNLAEPGRRAVDSKEIAEDLEMSFVERLVMDLCFKAPKSVHVSGPLALSIVPLLEKRRPDLKFVVDSALTVAGAAKGSP